jgi:hypothetical protein
LTLLKPRTFIRAEKVRLIESGQLTPETRESLRRSYPWLTIHQIDSNAFYGRMKGAA